MLLSRKKVLFELALILTMLTSSLFLTAQDLDVDQFHQKGFENFLKQNKLSPLEKAILTHDLESVQALVDKGTPINLNSTDKASPLLYAVIADDMPIAEFLLKKGAKVNAESAGGITPLWMAVHWNLVDMARLLISHGADVHFPLKGATVVDVAKVNKFSEMEKLLRSSGGLETPHASKLASKSPDQASSNGDEKLPTGSARKEADKKSPADRPKEKNP